MVRFRSILTALAGVTLLASVAVAQGPGGFQLTPAIRAKFQAWQKWNEAHKNIGAVQQTVFAMAEMQNNPKTKFTKPQAKAILAVLKTWRNKPVMTDSQARNVNKKLAATFTMPQLKALAAMPQRGGRRMGGGGQGGQRPGGAGGGRPGGGRGGFDPSKIPAPRDYNPLNPGTLPMERQRARAAQRIDGLIKTLAAIR
jgi:hypothetical protein